MISPGATALVDVLETWVTARELLWEAGPRSYVRDGIGRFASKSSSEIGNDIRALDAKIAVRERKHMSLGAVDKKKAARDTELQDLKNERAEAVAAQKEARASEKGEKAATAEPAAATKPETTTKAADDGTASVANDAPTEPFVTDAELSQGLDDWVGANNYKEVQTASRDMQAGKVPKGHEGKLAQEYVRRFEPQDEMYRGVKLSPKDAAKLTEGATMGMPLSSFTKDQGVGVEFAASFSKPGDSHVVFKVSNGAGYDISGHTRGSAFAYQKEVISGGSYRVKSVTEVTVRGGSVKGGSPRDKWRPTYEIKTYKLVELEPMPLTSSERSKIAKQAADARWAGHVAETP